MKKSTVSIISALSAMSMAFSSSVFAASDQTTAINTATTTTVSSSIGVEYRGHIQNQGDTDWAADGVELGTTGLSQGLEALEVQIIPSDSDSSDSDGTGNLTEV